MNTSKSLALIALCCLIFQSQAAWPDNSRLLATGGATQVEGAAGGGIVPWAVMAGYGSSDEFGGSAFFTRVDTDDYSLNTYGLAASYDNRIEASISRQDFSLGTLGDAIGQPGKHFRMTTFGLKARLWGDLIYGKLPQFSVGMQYKKQHDFAVPASVGAVKDKDTEFYISATKLWLAGFLDRNILVNATLRRTRANQIGIIGFGGDKDNQYDIVFEGSIATFINRHIVVGAEYRQQPDKLSFSEQDDWWDLFAGYFPNKHVSVILSYANLGTVATLPRQDGWYVSMELAY